MATQRYTWEDSLIDAKANNTIPSGAMTLCLQLAKAILWEPKDGRPSGLYWSNDEALRSVGASRATYFRYRRLLFEAGFFKEVNGNLIPLVPESQVETIVSDRDFLTDAESQIETDTDTEKSQVETTESQVETEKSQVDTPYSVDIYTVDEYSEAEVEWEVWEEPVVADAPTSAPSLISNGEGIDTSSNCTSTSNDSDERSEAPGEASTTIDLENVDVPQSQLETKHYYMNHLEEEAFKGICMVYEATPEQIALASELITNGQVSAKRFQDMAEQALEMTGAVSGW